MTLNPAQAHKLIIPNEINRNCRVSIVIPVRNEAETIAETLKSLVNQVDLKNHRLAPDSFEIIILANNCTDNSADIVRFFAKANSDLNIHLAETHLPPEKANVGYVRRRLMNEAYARLCQNKFKSGVIMTTDGDTCPAPNWIVANLREIKNGADAVGGRILMKPRGLREMNEKTRRFHLLDTGYRLLAAELEARLDYIAHDYLPRHHQHFNGSFAVTTAAFDRAGGIPPVSFLEDVAFFQSLMRVDARFRHSPFVRVETSSRIAGRAEMGLSTQIKEWTVMGENGDTYFVENAASIAQRINLRSVLRSVWNGKEANFARITRLADDLMISPNMLKNELQIKQTFGSLLEKVQRAQNAGGEWQRRYPLVCVSRAIWDLRQILEIARRQNHSPDRFFSQTSNR